MKEAYGRSLTELIPGHGRSITRFIGTLFACYLRPWPGAATLIVNSTLDSRFIWFYYCILLTLYISWLWILLLTIQSISYISFILISYNGISIDYLYYLFLLLLI